MKKILVFLCTVLVVTAMFATGKNTYETHALTEEEAAWVEEARLALQELLAEKEIMALVYMSDEYAVREAATEESATVTTVHSGHTVFIKDVVINDNYEAWAYVSFYSGGQEYLGYVSRENLACSDERFLAWESDYGMNPDAAAMYTEEGVSTSANGVDQFPERYQAALQALAEKHPNWVFVKQVTNLDWDTVIDNELKDGRSLVYKTFPDYVKDGAYDDGNWFYASRGILEYYMDPRNSLQEDTVFQFEQLTYNEQYHTLEAVESFLENTFMNSSQYAPGTEMTHAYIFYMIAKEEGREVSPFHLVARVIQEQGMNGGSALISGTYEGANGAYKGYYNYFNCGASGTTTTQVIENGLAYATAREWNNAYFSILGGADIISANYIKKGQDTLYLQKYNVGPDAQHAHYTHQYMQNISAPTTEGKSMKKLYANANSLENTFVFKIPVFNDMPSEACPYPTETDLYLSHDGERMKPLDEDGLNYVSYEEGDLVFGLYNGEQPLAANDVTVTIASADEMLADAIAVETDENGNLYVRIAADGVKNSIGEETGLTGLGGEALGFAVQIYDKESDLIFDHSYQVLQKGVLLENSVGHSTFLKNGVTYQMPMDEIQRILLQESGLLQDKVTDITLTSSNKAVLSFRGFYMEPKKPGTVTVKVSYKIGETSYTKTVKVKVVAESSFTFGYLDKNGEWVSFSNGENLEIEQGEALNIYTSISPRILSNVKVTCDNSDVISIDGSISESYVYEEVPDLAYIQKNTALLSAASYNTGKAIVTMTAKYSGKTYTQKVTFNVVEPKGLQLKEMYWQGDGQGYAAEGRRETEIYIDRYKALTMLGIYDDNADGDTVPGKAGDYKLEFLKRDADSENYMTSTDFFAEYVDDFVFYIVPDLDTLEDSDYSQIVRITSLNASEEADYIELPIYYSDSDSGIYLSYDKENGLSQPVDTVNLVEGEETTVYFRSAADSGSEFYLSGDTAKDYGCSLISTEVVGTEAAYGVSNYYNIIKAVISWDGSDTASKPLDLLLKSIKGSSVVAFEVKLHARHDEIKKVDVATLNQIASFVSATGSEGDISNVRIGDYEVKLLTLEDSSKCAIITGYLGNENDLYLPDCLEVDVRANAGSTADHAMTVAKEITVIGCEDGVFDTVESYYQPVNVYLPSGYTYFGEQSAGWTNAGSGKRTEYYFRDGGSVGSASAIVSGMLFAKTDENYICVDTGNVSTAAVVDGAVILYKNRTMGSTGLNLIASGNVYDYALKSEWLLNNNDEEIPIHVEKGNGSYTLTVDSTHVNGGMIQELESGTYYLKLAPVVMVEGQAVELDESLCKVKVTFKEETPIVTAQSNITINTYFGAEAAVPLEITNSFGTKVTKVTLTEQEAGLSIAQKEDGTWLLCWDGVTAIPSGTAITLIYEVEGYAAEVAGEEIAPQTITVTGAKTQPVASLSATTVTLMGYPYEAQELELVVTNNDYRNRVTVAPEDIKVTSAPKGSDASEIYLTLENGVLTVDASNNATPGTYKYTITPKLGDGNVSAKSVTLTVNVKGTKPAVKFAGTATVTLNTNLYNTKAELPGLIFTTAAGSEIGEGVVNPETAKITASVKSKPSKADDDAVSITAVYGDAYRTDEAGNTYYALDEIVLQAAVTASASKGSYVFNIKIPVMVEGDIVWMTTTATVKVVNTMPTAKLSATTVTLDAAYPNNDSDTVNNSAAAIRLVMNEGYTLTKLLVTEPNVNAGECIAVSYDTNGKITFDLVKAGLSVAGTYKLTPIIKAESGEEITLKTMNVTVKVTNSARATLSSKSKTMAVNPYVGSATLNAQLTTKGFGQQDGVTYSSEYIFIPTNALAQAAVEKVLVNLSVADGQVRVDDCEGAPNGKYTYNLVEKITGSDGTVAYTKPLAFTVKMAAKALTIVPAKSTITLYKEYCRAEVVNDVAYYVAEIPVNIKERDGMLTDYVATTPTHSMESKNIGVQFGVNSAGQSHVIVRIPEGMSEVKGLKIIPEASTENMAISAFVLNISIKNAAPEVSFARETVTLNRFTDTTVTNELSYAEGYSYSGVKNISVKNGSEDVTEQFWIVAENDSITLTIKDEYVDVVANGNYIVSVVPTIAFEVAGEAVTKELDTCSFTLKLEQPNVTVSVTEDEVASHTVNLYPDLNEIISEPLCVNASVGEKELTVSKVVVTTADKTVVAAARTEGGKIIFEACEVSAEPGANAEGNPYGNAAQSAYMNGKNIYNVQVYVKNANGLEDIPAGTLDKAFVVNVKTLPETVTLTSTNLTFSPYLQNAAITTVKNAELEALTAADDYSYEITVAETDSKYNVLTAEQQNDVLNVTGNADGTIVVTDKKLPSASVTYYYEAAIRLLKNSEETSETAATYTVKFKVAVKNTMPTVALQKTSVTLNSAYLNQAEQNGIFLKTGNSLWKLADYENWDIVVKNSKNKDITAEGYFDVIFATDAEGIYTGGMTIALQNQKDGKLFNVPNGTYKVILTPRVTSGFDSESQTAGVSSTDESEVAEVAEGYVNSKTITLGSVTLTVKVVSSRPTVKYLSTKLTVNTYTNEEKSTILTLSNAGTFDVANSVIVCSKLPKGASNADAVHVTLDADGTLMAYADRNAVAGTYTYTVTPATKLAGNTILLDSKTVSVVVQNKKPAAVLSSKAVTLNTLFADTYKTEIAVTAKNAGSYRYSFDKSTIVTTETKASNKANANLLLEQMEVVAKEDGSVGIIVSLPANTTIPNGTYKFKLTPVICSGNRLEISDTYALSTVSFSVKVENKKPTMSAKVKGNIDTLYVREGVTCQVSLGKQNYDEVGNISSVKLLDKSNGEVSPYFYIKQTEVDVQNGKYVIYAYNGASLNAGKSYALQLAATSSTGQVYLANVTVKVTKSSYKVTAKAANFYTEINSGTIALEFTNNPYADELFARSAVITGVSVDDAENSFACRLVPGTRNKIEIWTTQNLSGKIKEGDTIYIIFDVYSYGLAANKKPVQVKVPIVIK